jgi:hypothetical protein
MSKEKTPIEEIDELRFCQGCNSNPCTCDPKVEKWVNLTSDAKAIIKKLESKLIVKVKTNLR